MDKKFREFKKQLNRIYTNNKIYHKKMQEKHLMPNDITDWNDIKKLPLTTKEDLLKDYPNGWNCVDEEKIKISTQSVIKRELQRK